MSAKIIFLDGDSLTPEQLFTLGHEYVLSNGSKVEARLTENAWSRVKRGRRVVDDIVAGDDVVYGINTGFGLFSKVQIDKDQLETLQLNLIRSHSVGVGDYIPHRSSRMMLALRINVLAKGHSGISQRTLRQLIDALNADCVSCVPSQGTVGASGDLAPLSHLALGLLGEGDMWDVSESPAVPRPAAEVLRANKLKPLRLQSKEGLALINGTQFICGIGCEALVRAERIARQSDIIGAMTVEGLNGTIRAFDPRIHAARPHRGQNMSAARLRAILHTDKYPSEITESHVGCAVVQDAYTLRCMPQVHGIVHDTLAFVRSVLTVEINSATDNPMIFAKEWDKSSVSDDIVSGGNFHGEYPAKVLDFLAIATHELSSISERRIERLNNPDLSPPQLTSFLVKEGGLNSGFMMAHVTAAALVSENKVLCHPSSVDSLSTSAAKEDHVSMGGMAARKALTVVKNVEMVLAIELLCALQALDLQMPLKSTVPIEAVRAKMRAHIAFLERDRFMKPDIDKATELLKREEVWRAIEPFVDGGLFSASVCCGSLPLKSKL